MKTKLDNNDYDTMLEASDWRFSAAIVGLMQYFDFHNIKYEIEDEVEDEVDVDYILYNENYICEEKYLEFVESKYNDKLHHKVVENILKQTEISSDHIKLVNEKLKANTIMKNIFKDIKFDGENKDYILKIINDNRQEIIKETYRTKSDMYANFANTNQMFNDRQEWCRLLGYSIDSGKKGKSTGFNFDMNAFVGHDIKEFDFIPFAFEGDREVFFINDNFSIKRLKISNKMLSKTLSKKDDEKIKNSRQAFFKGIIESVDFINRDVEVITKNRDKTYFETLFIRKKSIDVLKKLKDYVDYKCFNFSYKVTDKYYRNIQKEVMECILNNIFLDDLLELFLKEKREYVVSQMLKINILMRGENGMKDKLKGAYACAKQVAQALESNKIETYRQKLTSSIIFKDYDRVCQILLQLSNYSNIEFGFVYDLYDDFENNKDLVYTFINALNRSNKNDNGSNKK